MSHPKYPKEGKDSDTKSEGTDKKNQSRRLRIKNAIKARSSGSPDKEVRKGSGASEETLREAAIQRAGLSPGPPRDHRLLAKQILATALVKDIQIIDAASDNEVVREFKDLESTVKEWSSAFIHPLPDQIPPLNAEDAARLKFIAPDAVLPTGLQNLLRYPSDRRQVAKGYVYRMLYERVFAIHPRQQQTSNSGSIIPQPNCPDLWISAEAATAISTLSQIFQNEISLSSQPHAHDAPPTVDSPMHMTPRDYHTWRAYTLGLLARTCTAVTDPHAISTAQTQTIVADTWSLLAGWLPTAHHTTAHFGLGVIVAKAVHITRLLRVQRAYWSIAYPDGTGEAGSGVQDQTESMLASSSPLPLRFSPTTMVDRGTSQGQVGEMPQEALRDRLVDLMIRPALFKRGDAAGGQLDVESCPMRAEVRCRQV